MLTDQQQTELHKSILAYFKSQSKYTDAYNSLSDALNTKLADTEQQQYSNKLIDKWSSVVKLQKRIIDLEAQLNNNNNNTNILSLPTQTIKYTLYGHKSIVNCICFHTQYNILYSCSNDATIRYYDIHTGQLINVLQTHTSAVNYIDINSNGTMLASCSNDSTIKLYTITTTNTTCIKTLYGHDNTVCCIQFDSQNSDILYSSSTDNTIRIWNIHNIQCINTIQTTTVCKRIVVSSDGLHIAGCGSDKSIYIYNTKTNQCDIILNGHEHIVDCILFSTTVSEPIITTMLNESRHNNTTVAADKQYHISHKYLITGSRDKTIKLWNLSTQQCVRTITVHDNWVKSILLHNSGRYIISCSDDKTIRVFDITKQCKHIVTLDNISSSMFTTMQYSSSAQLLGTGCIDGSVNLYVCKPLMHHSATSTTLSNGKT